MRDEVTQTFESAALATDGPSLCRLSGMKPGIRISDLDAENAYAERLWHAYVENHTEATFFHKPEWRKIISSQFGYDVYYRCAWQEGRLVGILPLTHVKTLIFGQSLVSTAFTVGGGILADNPEVARSLADDAISLSNRLNVPVIELRSFVNLQDAWTVKSNTYAGFVKAINSDEDERLKEVPRKKRADVRKGIKTAPSVTEEADTKAFYKLYSESLRNLGTPTHSMQWFEKIREAFADHVDVSTINGPDGPVSGLMSFYFKDTVMPYYGGASFAARKLHAYDYMYWKQMERAINSGYSQFDFGRSKLGSGAADYKHHWGFSAEALSYQYYLSQGTEMPDINPNNPKYQLFVKSWKRLPLPVANSIGPFFARQLA